MSAMTVGEAVKRLLFDLPPTIDGAPTLIKAAVYPAEEDV